MICSGFFICMELEKLIIVTTVASGLLFLVCKSLVVNGGMM